jgi:enoyl-CoA hydratase/carnithine racemase
VDLVVGAWLLADLVGRSVAMDLALTGRWMDSAEAAQLGLVNRIAEKPETVAEEIASGLTARPAVKKVMASGDLMERLRAERLANQAAWADRIGRIDRIGR